MIAGTSRNKQQKGRVCILLLIMVARVVAWAADPPPIEKLVPQSDGRIRVFETRGPQPLRVIGKEPNQVSIRALAISPDRHSAGWLVDLPNCCTSYPIPMTLVIYRGEGFPLLRFGTGQGIWAWAYRERGQQVAFCSAPAHGGAVYDYQLREVRSGRLLDTWMGRPGDERAPTWTRRLIAE